MEEIWHLLNGFMVKQTPKRHKTQFFHRVNANHNFMSGGKLIEKEHTRRGPVIITGLRRYCNGWSLEERDDFDENQQ
jgi:hypothetical protein